MNLRAYIYLWWAELIEFGGHDLGTKENGSERFFMVNFHGTELCVHPHILWNLLQKLLHCDMLRLEEEYFYCKTFCIMVTVSLNTIRCCREVMITVSRINIPSRQMMDSTYNQAWTPRRKPPRLPYRGTYRPPGWCWCPLGYGLLRWPSLRREWSHDVQQRLRVVGESGHFFDPPAIDTGGREIVDSDMISCWLEQGGYFEPTPCSMTCSMHKNYVLLHLIDLSIL